MSTGHSQDPALLRLFLDRLTGSGTPAEAVFLTFNADLPFFESRLLGSVRAVNAVVSVIADARVWRPDQHAIAAAGISYHVGLVKASNAFHPKLSLVVSDRNALAVVGSGNLTLPGWATNAEVSTVFTGGPESAPAALADIRDTLASLAERGVLDSFTTERVAAAVKRLTVFLEETPVDDTGHRVFASWDGALIEHLPQGPVDELLLSAPFLDSDSKAVRALIDRMQPSSVRLALQPGMSVFERDSLTKVFDAFRPTIDIAVEAIQDNRYHHGKLIEWVVDGQRWSLTGSANLSGRALLGAAPSGNYELAVIAPVDSTLFPTASPVDLAQVTSSPRSDSPPREMMAPLAAVVRNGHVELTVSRPSTDVDVEMATPPNLDHWEGVATIPAGANVVRIPACPPGARLRLVVVDPEGLRRESSPAFVSDPDRILERSHRRTESPLWQDLVDDAALRVALQELSGEVPEEDSSWVEGLGDESDISDIEPAGAEEDTTEPDIDARPDAEPEPESDTALRDLRRKLCVKITASSAHRSTTLPEKLQQLVVSLWCWRIGVWDTDEEPVELVSKQLDAILESEPDAPIWAARRAAVLAIGLVLTATHIDEGKTVPTTLAFRRRCQQAAPHWDAVTPPLVERFARAVAGAGADRLIEQVMDFTDPTNDELSRAILAVVDDHDYDVTRIDSRSALIQGAIPTDRLEPLAWAIVGTAEDLDAVVIWTLNEEGSWALAAWQAPDLLLVRQQPNGSQRWAHHHLNNPSGFGPKALYQSQIVRMEPSPPHDKRIVWSGEETNKMREVLSAVGLTGPTPPVHIAEVRG